VVEVPRSHANLALDRAGWIGPPILFSPMMGFRIERQLWNFEEGAFAGPVPGNAVVSRWS
jgi:hypothetical protein